MIKVVKEKDEFSYTVRIYDFDNKQKMEISYGGNLDLYWTLQDAYSESNLVLHECDGEVYEIFNEMYDGIVNSKSLLIDDSKIDVGNVREYDEYNFYDPVEKSINYGTENTYYDESIGTASLVQGDKEYTIRFKGEFDDLPSVCISPSGSRYGYFPGYYRQCYDKLLKMAIEDPRKVEEEFNKAKTASKDTKIMDKHQ